MARKIISALVASLSLAILGSGGVFVLQAPAAATDVSWPVGPPTCC